jgi:antitoxin component YwqK of YwqJK toxin-antitoxin module
LRLFCILISFLLTGFYGSNAQTYKIWKGDTINFKDKNNLKQGIWVSFYKNGFKKSEITYLNGKKNGYAVIYFENGNISEEGTWMVNKWTGKYRSYYRNGKLRYRWNYNEKGNRSGYQAYYYENGNIKIEGDWDNGKENGTIKDYRTDGSLRSEKTFNEGKVDSAGIKTYDPKEKRINKENKLSENLTNIKKQDSLTVFTGTGYHKFYNIHKKLEKEGEFKNGLLFKGKHYIYDESGLLIKTIIYENGKISKQIIHKK